MTAQMQPTNKAATVRPVAGRPPLPTQMSLTPKEILGILRRHLLLIIVFAILRTIKHEVMLVVGHYVRS